MTDLEDLLPTFESKTIPTEAGRIFARTAGSGPPLVLLHGFPETLAMWHRLAPALSRHFSVVAMDLRGYGWSSAPKSRGGEAYAKRQMGRDVVAVMEALGHATFALAGHDRGARVGYRLALDAPGRITKLALLDIYPTVEVWRKIEAGTGVSPHWPRLATAEPQPETEIGRDPDGYFTGLMSHWTRGRNLHAFDPRALALYRAAWGDPSRIHAMCEDYRAGATLDRAADEADEAAAKTIPCPVLILAGTDYLASGDGETPLDIWRRGFAPHAQGQTIPSGHFLAEEAPEATLAALEAFL
ncbi:MAG TPA: alpha/beta hydrolase [Lichenihabitans sp.]|nr:alpha/beta hydrolase [Lichenihabitans sp.]